tara:strand:- start:636 stop:2543 length:1908 start_codon:yes stop_codon:yes gene_type:complete
MRKKRNQIVPGVMKSKVTHTKTMDGKYYFSDGWLCPGPKKSPNCVLVGKQNIIKDINRKKGPSHIPGDDNILIAPRWPRLPRDPECFVAGTKIMMKYGDDKNIEDVEIGDEVLSYNVHTNEFEPKLVTKLYNQTHNLKDGDITVKITFDNNQMIHSTIANPFWSKNKGFVAVDEKRCNRVHSWVIETNGGILVDSLNSGDTLFRYNNNDGSLEEITVTDIEYVMEKGIETFDIHVEDNHTFFADGILTHNSGPPGPPPPPPPPPPPGPITEFGYQCINNQCVVSAYAEYVSYGDCALHCGSSSPPPPGGNPITGYNCELHYLSGEYHAACMPSYESNPHYDSLSSCEGSCTTSQYRCYGSAYCYDCGFDPNTLSVHRDGQDWDYVDPMECELDGTNGNCGDVNYQDYQSQFPTVNGYQNVCELFRTQANCESGKLLDEHGNRTAAHNMGSLVSSNQATEILLESPWNVESTKQLGPIPLAGELTAGNQMQTPEWYLQETGAGYFDEPEISFNPSEWGYDNMGNLITQHTSILNETNLQAAWGCAWVYWPSNVAPGPPPPGGGDPGTCNCGYQPYVQAGPTFNYDVQICVAGPPPFSAEQFGATNNCSPGCVPRCQQWSNGQSPSPSSCTGCYCEC